MKTTTVRQWMISKIKDHWFFETERLDAMSDDEIRELFESLLDWIEE